MRARLPDWLRPVAAWLFHPYVLIGLAAFSAVLFVLSAVGVPWFLARVPADYFSRRERAGLGLPRHARPRGYALLRVGKNLLGLVLLAAGVAMLILPGQGLLTVCVSLFLLDFPGKRRLERRVLGYPPVLRALNRLRARAGRPPFPSF